MEQQAAFFSLWPRQATVGLNEGSQTVTVSQALGFSHLSLPMQQMSPLSSKVGKRQGNLKEIDEIR